MGAVVFCAVFFKRFYPFRLFHVLVLQLIVEQSVLASDEQVVRGCLDGEA